MNDLTNELCGGRAFVGRNKRRAVPMSNGRSIARSITGVAGVVFLWMTYAAAAQTITPEEEQKTFELADGFQANLYASEVDGVLNPLAMRWDAEGRLYVISTLAYPQLRPGEIPNDKIILLEDTNHDGRVDKSTVFAEGLNIPTGLEVGDGGVYVGEQTDLLFLKDTDGDGRADHREVVLSGFGTGDTHQAINSFVWSPGGELFFDQGDGIESRVETPWGISSLFQAGVFRFRPQRLQLGPLLDDFMGPGNPWGIAFDDWGQAFVVDGAGGVTFLSPAMLPVKHRLRLRTIGKPGGYCGVEILGSEHLPEAFQGDFLVGDFHRNRIGRFETKAVGAGFEVNWKPPLLVSTHRNFRPVDVRTGPDGAIYICDWYNSVICHQDDPFRIPERDLTHGRIWRIAHESSRRIQRPNLRNATLEHLFQQLRSPERWVRYQAKRVLASRERSSVAEALPAWWNSRSSAEQTDHLLFELIGVLESIESPDQDLLRQLLVAEDHRARAYATRVVGRWHDRIANPLALLETRMHDQHPVVRMEAIVACAHVPDARSVEVAAMAADLSLDYDIDYALTQAVHHLKGHWIPAFQRGELTFEGKAGRMSQVIQRVNSAKLTSTLREMAAAAIGDESSQLELLKTLARVGEAGDLGMVLVRAAEQPTVSAELLKELEYAFRTNSIKPPADCKPALESLLSSSDPDTQLQAIKLAGLWQESDHLNRILEIYHDAGSDRQVRRAALRALGKMGGDTSRVALEECAESDDFEMRLTAVAALCGVDLPVSAKWGTKLLLSGERFREPHYEELLRGFLARRDGLQELSAQLANVQLSAEVAQGLLHALIAAGQSHEDLISVLNRAAGVSSSVPEFSEEYVAALTQQVAKADPYRGEIVFRSKLANCYACHQIGGAGGTIGPDLSAVGTTLPMDRMIQEVFWPGRLVKEGFSLRQVVTIDGEVHQGYLRKGRHHQSVYLQLLHSGELVRIPKEAIEDEQEAGSAMPTNAVAALTEEERLDLLSFLSRLGTPGDFSVAHQDIVRAWKVCRNTPDLSPSLAVSLASSDAENDWMPAISRVSGTLPLDELVMSEAGQILLKSSFETPMARRRLEFDTTSGLQLWVDGKVVAVDENIELQFAAGVHELTILVDMTQRPSKELRAEWHKLD